MKTFNAAQEKARMAIDQWNDARAEFEALKEVQVSARVSPESANFLQTFQELYGQSRAEVIRTALDAGLAALMDARLNTGGDFVRLYDPFVAQQIKERNEAFGQPVPPLPVTLAELQQLEALKPEQEGNA